VYFSPITNVLEVFKFIGMNLYHILDSGIPIRTPHHTF
jgi:hypothetical protein